MLFLNEPNLPHRSKKSSIFFDLLTRRIYENSSQCLLTITSHGGMPKLRIPGYVMVSKHSSVYD